MISFLGNSMYGLMTILFLSEEAFEVASKEWLCCSGLTKHVNQVITTLKFQFVTVFFNSESPESNICTYRASTRSLFQAMW